MDSILTSIKKLLGIEEEYEHFDPNIIMCINTAFTVLTQLGVGPANGFSISDKNSKWSDFISDMSKMEAVKTYIHMRVRLLFDPPINSSITESINKTIEELEWRLNTVGEEDTTVYPDPKPDNPAPSDPDYDDLKEEIIEDILDRLTNGDEVKY